MKLYLFMTNGITGMGGGQMYVNNKARFMRDKNWETCVISGLPGKVVIPGLMEYEKYIDASLQFPLVYSRKQREQKMKKIITLLDLQKYDEVFIESGIAYMAYWAEQLASLIGARHLAYLLDERNDLLVPTEHLPFFEFKYNRRELAGIADNSISMLFRNKIDLEAGEKCRLPAVCQNVVEDCEHSILQEIRNDSIALCCIGRLEKEFVMSAVTAFSKVVTNHPSQQFDVVMIGGTADGELVKSIESKFSGINNVKLIMAGHVFPIPRGLFSKLDVVISSAGSAGVAYREGVPTISIDGRDAMAIGVVGYTTQNRLYRDQEPQLDAADLVEKILYENYLDNFVFTPCDYQPDLSLLETHIQFVEKMEKEKAYFPIDSLTPNVKDRIKRIVCSILGVENFLRIIEFKSKHIG